MPTLKANVERSPGPWVFDAAVGVVRAANRIMANIPGHAAHGEHCVACCDGRLIAAAPDLLAKLIDADRLIMQLATVVANEKIAGYIPFGLDEKCKEWLRDGAASVIAKAEGRV